MTMPVNTLQPHNKHCIFNFTSWLGPWTFYVLHVMARSKKPCILHSFYDGPWDTTYPTFSYDYPQEHLSTSFYAQNCKHPKFQFIPHHPVFCCCCKWLCAYCIPLHVVNGCKTTYIQFILWLALWAHHMPLHLMTRPMSTISSTSSYEQTHQHCTVHFMTKFMDTLHSLTFHEQHRSRFTVWLAPRTPCTHFILWSAPRAPCIPLHFSNTTKTSYIPVLMNRFVSTLHSSRFFDPPHEHPEFFILWPTLWKTCIPLHLKYSSKDSMFHFICCLAPWDSIISTLFCHGPHEQLKIALHWKCGPRSTLYSISFNDQHHEHPTFHFILSTDPSTNYIQMNLITGPINTIYSISFNDWSNEHLQFPLFFWTDSNN